MIPKSSSSLGLDRTPSVTSKAESTESQVEKQQIAEYVHNFKREVETKFMASKVNQTFAFPRYETSQQVLIADSKKSLASLENVQFFDLTSDNVKRKLKENFEKPRNSETDFLVDALTSVGRLNRDYLQSQIKSSSSPLIKYIYLSLKKKMTSDPQNESELAAIDKQTLDRQKIKKSLRSISKVNLSLAPTADNDNTSRYKVSTGFHPSKATPTRINSEVKKPFKVSQRTKNDLMMSSAKIAVSPIRPTPKLKLSSRPVVVEGIVSAKPKTKLGLLLSAKSFETLKKPDTSFRGTQNSLFQNFIRKMKAENTQSIRITSNRSQERNHNLSGLRSTQKAEKSAIGIGLSMSKGQIENYVGKLLMKQSYRPKTRRETGDDGHELQENRKNWEVSRDDVLKEKLKKSFLRSKNRC